MDILTDSPTLPEDYSDVDIVIVDEVDNSRLKDTLSVNEPLPESAAAQPREYHRREKKEVALSLLDGQGSGPVKRMTTTQPPSSSTDSVLQTSSKSNDDEMDCVIRSEDNTGSVPSSSNNSTPYSRNLFIDIDPNLESRAKRSTNDKKSKQTVVSDSRRLSDSSDEVSVTDNNEKKRRSSVKPTNKSTNKSKATTALSPNYSDQMLSICLPGYNWLEKKLSDGPKENHKDDNNSDNSCTIIEEKSLKSTSSADFDGKISKPENNQSIAILNNSEEVKSIELLQVPSKQEDCRLKESNNNNNNIDIKKMDVNIPDDSAGHWSDCVIVVNDSLSDQAVSDRHVDEEPILLPAIEDTHSGNRSFQTNFSSQSNTEPEESRVNIDESTQDDIILVGVTTSNASLDLENRYNKSDFTSNQHSKDEVIQGNNGELINFQNINGVRQSPVGTDEFSNKTLFGKGSSNNDSHSSSKEILPPTEPTYSIATATGTVSVPPPILSNESNCLEEDINVRSPEILETCKSLYQKIQSLVTKTEDWEVNRRPYKASTGEAVNRTLQDAIHAAMVRAIKEDSVDDVSMPKVQRTILSGNDGKLVERKIDIPTDNTFQSVRGHVTTNQTHLPPKKRLLSVDKSEDTNGCNRSPPLSKRRKTISRVQKVLPIILTGSEDGKSSKMGTGDDGYNSIVIEEDSDDNFDDGLQKKDIFTSQLGPTCIQDMLKAERCPAPNPLPLENLVMDNKTGFAISQKQTTLLKDSPKCKKKKVAKNVRSSPNVAITSKAMPPKSVISGSNFVEYRTTEYPNTSYTHVGDKEVTFRELRALQSPISSHDGRALDHLDYRLISRSADLQKQFFAATSSQFPYHQASTKISSSPVTYDLTKRNEQNVSSMDNSPRGPNIGVPFSCSVPTQSHILNIPQNATYQWKQTSIGIPGKSNEISPAAPSTTPKPNPIAGHAFYPVMPSNKVNRSQAVMQAPPSSNQHLQPQSIQIRPAHLSGQMIKPNELNRQLPRTFITTPHRNYLGHGLPSAPSPQPMMVEPYPPFPVNANYPSISNANLTTIIHPIMSSHSNVSNVPSRPDYVTNKHLSPITNELLTSVPYNPNCGYIPRSSEGLTVLDQRYTNPQIYPLPSHPYNGNGVPSDERNLYWSNTRIGQMPVINQKNMKP